MAQLYVHTYLATLTSSPAVLKPSVPSFYLKLSSYATRRTTESADSSFSSYHKLLKGDVGASAVKLPFRKTLSFHGKCFFYADYPADLFARKCATQPEKSPYPYSKVFTNFIRVNKV